MVDCPGWRDVERARRGPGLPTTVAPPTTAGELATGAVLTCRPDPPVLEGQHPVTTVLVLDTGGTLAVMESGVVNPVLLADVIVGEVGSGLNCTRLLDPGSAIMSGIGSGLPS